MPSEIKYKDIKFIYRWHLITEQQVGALVMELGRFFIKECLNRKKWWDCILNIYL